MAPEQLFATEDWHDPASKEAALGALLNPVRLPLVFGALGSLDIEGTPKVLDLGCGGGLVSAPLSDAGLPVIGVDVSLRPLVGAARRDRSGSYVGASGAHLPFRSGHFDAVLALEVLEHVGDPVVIVGEVARVLRPGGVFIFGGPSRTWLSRIVLIWLAQEFPLTRLLPPDLHRWSQFIKPCEMAEIQSGHGIRPAWVLGISPGLGGIARAPWAVLNAKLGRRSFASVAAGLRMRRVRSTRLAYLGCGVRASSAPSAPMTPHNTDRYTSM